MSKTFKQAFVITGDASGGVKAFKVTEDAASKLTTTVNKSSKSFNKHSRSVDLSNRSLSGLALNAKSVLGVFSGGLAAREALQMADAAKVMDARLALATDSTLELATAKDELKDISRATYSALEANATLYSRMEVNTEELGISQDKLLLSVQSLRDSYRAYGTQASEADAATLQLTQAMAKGKLDGDEFKSVMENAPLVMKALTKELGITKKELFEFSADGKLQVEDLVNALANSADEFAEKAAQMPVKMSEATSVLSNSLTLYVADIDAATGASQAFSSSIVYIADNIEVIADTVIHSVTAFAIYKGVKGLAGISLAMATVETRTIKLSDGIGGYTTKVVTSAAKTNLLTRATKGLGAAIRANPIGLAITAGFLAYEGINYLLDEHNDKLEELSKQSEETADSIKTVNAEFEKGFEADFSNVSDSISDLNNELNQLAVNYAEAQAKLVKNIKSGDVHSLGLDIAGNLLTGNGFNSSEELANEAKRKEIENTLALAKANEFLTNTFGPLIAEAKKLTNAENANAEALATNKLEIDEWIESSEKQLEKLTRQNEVYGLSAVEIIELDAKKQLLLATDENQRKAIEDTTEALLKEANQLKANQLETKKLATQTKLSENNLKSARGIIKSLTAEHRPIQAMFQDLSASMEVINSARISPDFSDEEFQEGMELLQEEADEMAEAIMGEIKGVFENIPGLFNDSIEEIDDIDLSGKFDDFAQGLNPAISALQSFKDEIAFINELTESGQFTAGQQAFYSTGLAAEFALNSMASMAQEGSDAQAKLQAAATITNTILGISAILEQGKGDPYTAFARMAAMAAMVASMGVQVAGAFGGSGGGGAERQQEIQGTGTVLGDATAKSESMANSLELIADASEKIVGINSSMLRSLKTMSDAISGTANQIARGGEIGDLGTVAGNVGGTLGGILGGLFSSIGSFLFGSSKIRDRGIQILGGNIADAINGTLFQAYEVARRSGLFGSSTITGFGELDDSISSQFSLIFESMNDAILSGSEALGLNSQEVQAALDAYQIEEQRISLLDLSAEEQQAQLEAVFSSIFDGLVSASIPFITQFQQAGEGLGETLARVSTTVLVFEEAIDSMGLDFIAKELDPELFAQSAVAISDFAGGMESFIDGYTNYVSNFLSEGEQLEILGGRIGGVFDEIGLTLPATREGFVDLIQGLDLTTASGQEAFGTLIALSSEIDTFYSGLDDLWQNFFETFYSPEELLNQSIGSSSELLGQQAADLGIDPNISLSAFRELFEAQVAAGELTTEQTVQWLEFGATIGRVNDLLEEQNAIEAERVRLLQEYNDFGESLQDQINQANSSEFINSLANIRQQEAENIATLNELAVAAGLAGASEEDLMRAHQLAQTQIDATVANLRSLISSLVDQLYSDDLDNRIAELEAQQTSSIDAVGEASTNLFDSWVRTIQSIRDYTQGLLLGEHSPLEADERLEEAQSQFDAALAAALGGDLDAAQSLTGLADTVLNLAALTEASGSDYNEIFNSIYDALNSVDIPNGLGPNDHTYTVSISSELQALYDEREAREIAGRAENRLALATQLAQHLNELALAVNQPLFEIANEIGLNMTSLVTDLGVNLDDLTAASVQNLANISSLLGVELSELATNLGEDVSLALGELADSQSLLNDALEGTIDGLPTEYRDLLAPLLRDVENAADGTAQELALASLETATSSLPVEYQNALAPYFDSIDPVSELEEQNDYLSQTVSWLEDIRNILANGYGLTIPSEEIGPLPPTDPTDPTDQTINSDPIGPTFSTEPITDELIVQSDYLLDIRNSVNRDVTDPGYNSFIPGRNSVNSNKKDELISEVKSLTKIISSIQTQLNRLNITNEEISDNTASISGTNDQILKKAPLINKGRSKRSGSLFG